ncbi:phage virion morphogenesis protein [Spirosoma aerolatum]|uniref:phage virion morphogenesis protein n=1 Tax=Spirosoma aerolatum TaxID=1211326 RepID=UPI0009AD0706|nr:phage virion morphogenesis protein [Spirosoma aerolatum]
MRPEELKAKAQQVHQLMTHDVYIIAGVEAVRQTHQAFEEEGFTDKTFVPWPDISQKRKDQKRKANGDLAKILHDTGNLEDSIDYEAQPALHQVVIGTDVPYAARHNEGLSGMPEREFLGESEQMHERIVRKLDREFDRIFGH